MTWNVKTAVEYIYSHGPGFDEGYLIDMVTDILTNEERDWRQRAEDALTVLAARNDVFSRQDDDVPPPDYELIGDY